MKKAEKEWPEVVSVLLGTIDLFICLFRAIPWHMELPRLGVELEL